MLENHAFNSFSATFRDRLDGLQETVEEVRAMECGSLLVPDFLYKILKFLIRAASLFDFFHIV